MGAPTAPAVPAAAVPLTPVPAMPNVPVGPTTIAGTGITVVAWVLAIVTALTGHGDSQTVELVVTGALGLVTPSIVLIGRYVQAKILAQKTPGA